MHLYQTMSGSKTIKKNIKGTEMLNLVPVSLLLLSLNNMMQREL